MRAAGPVINCRVAYSSRRRRRRRLEAFEMPKAAASRVKLSLDKASSAQEKFRLLWTAPTIENGADQLRNQQPAVAMILSACESSPLHLEAASMANEQSAYSSARFGFVGIKDRELLINRCEMRNGGASKHTTE